MDISYILRYLLLVFWNFHVWSIHWVSLILVSLFKTEDIRGVRFEFLLELVEIAGTSIDLTSSKSFTSTVIKLTNHRVIKYRDPLLLLLDTVIVPKVSGSSSMYHTRFEFVIHLLFITMSIDRNIILYLDWCHYLCELTLLVAKAVQSNKQVLWVLQYFIRFLSFIHFLVTSWTKILIVVLFREHFRPKGRIVDVKIFLKTISSHKQVDSNINELL